MRISLIAFIMVSTLSSESGHAEEREVLGTWQDNVGVAWKHTITIVKEGAKYYRESRFEDSSSRAELLEVPAKPNEKRRFKDLGSSHGEIYAVDAAGNLDLYDSEGFIREARRISPAREQQSQGPCPAPTLYARSRINIRSGPGLAERIVRNAVPGEALKCESSQQEWFRITGEGASQEWVHSSVVSTSPTAATHSGGPESCYALGVRFGRCSALSMQGRRCQPEDDIVKPARCVGDASFDRGILAGVKQVSGG